MRKKYKITAFTRLLIFMIFFTPIAYIGASYYNGEDGIANIRALFEGDSATISVEDQIANKNSEIVNLEAKIETLKRDVKRLEASK